MLPDVIDPLLKRLQQRLCETRPSTDLPIQPPTLPRPPLDMQELLLAERELGRRLPDIVRRTYTEVSDGGWGPGYGIYPLRDPDAGCSVVECYQAILTGDPSGEWPSHLLEFCDWGCNSFSALDCSHPACPIFRFDPDRWTEEAGLAGCLVPESDALEEWLTAWLDGEPLWKRVPRGG